MADGATHASGGLPPGPRAAPGRIVIGLVNNMPDAALAATERQFAGLIEAAAGDLDVELRLFSLDSLPRGHNARAMMAGRYADLAALEASAIDALIVTGAEPKAERLSDEPYWPQMTRLIGWAEAHTLGVVWSCLAAHAAVLHLDGVERRLLPQKCSGVFRCEAMSDDPLLAGAPTLIQTPHSRRNAVVAADLTARGYRLLTHSREVGADLFVRRGQSLFVFFQGHPEYDADSLLKEYCRDMGLYLRGEMNRPAPPRGYLEPAEEAVFSAIADQAGQAPEDELIARFAEVAAGVTPAQTWRTQAEVVYRNWLRQIAVAKAARALKAPIGA